MSETSENLTSRDERSIQAFNENLVSSPEVLDRLRKQHPHFKGNWSQLERLVANLEEDAHRSDLESSGRLAAWSRWAESMERGAIHLEGASLDGAHCEGACFREVHLEGASLHGVHFEKANLLGAHLEAAELIEAHLEEAMLNGARFEYAFLNDAHLMKAEMNGAHFEEAHMSGADLEGAYLQEAHLEVAFLAGANFRHAWLYDAHLERSFLENAHFEMADLVRANFERAELSGARLDSALVQHAHFQKADLSGAFFYDTQLTGSDLSEADVRGAKDLRFDDNSVYRIRIGGNAPDPWSVLRRKYTGPRFFWHLLLLVLFFAPYAGRVLALSAIAHGQTWWEHKSDEIIAAAENEHGEVPKHLNAMLGDARRQYDERFRQVPAAWVLIGGTKEWWIPVLAGIVFLYNGLRLFLTLRVGMLRDAEERSLITPRLQEYLPLWRVHRVARSLWLVAVGSVAINTAAWIFTTTVPVPR